jgi:very-short-patch-repair endonuclease
MSSPSPLGEGGARRSCGGRVRGVPTNDERRRLRQLRNRAREMRANPTDAERRLWTMLRDRRLPAAKFRRQHLVEPYIVDFVCVERSLIIEVDGSQHADSEYDQRRDAYLRSQGYSVLHFWNNDVLSNLSGVFDAIFAALHTPHPSAASRLPPSPLQGKGLGEFHG